MIPNKRGGAIPEGALTLYRILAVIIVALFTLGSSFVFYAPSINVRYAESLLLTRQVVECVSPNGIFDVRDLSTLQGESLFDYCKISGGNLDRIFVDASIRDSDGEELLLLEQGDSGSLWVRRVIDLNFEQKYSPGYYSNEFPILIITDNGQKEGSVLVRSLIKYEG